MVRNGVDSSRFAPGSGTAVRAGLGVGPDTLLIGMFASFKPVKNHAVLLKATSQLIQRGIDVQLLLAGDSVARGSASSILELGRLESLIAELKLDDRVITTGHRDDPETLYRACDVTVLPSLCEGTPNVVLESIACGVPAIVADVPGCREVASLCPTIRTFQSGDVDHLVSVLTTVYTQRHRLVDLGRLGRDQVLLHYEESRMLDEMQTAYQEVLGQRGA